MYLRSGRNKSCQCCPCWKTISWENFRASLWNTQITFTLNASLFHFFSIFSFSFFSYCCYYTFTSKKKPQMFFLYCQSPWRLVPFYYNKKVTFEIKGCGETYVPCMLSTAWCWTNKAASFFSALHEYWRLQLIKWQHRQLHQPAASARSILTLLARRNGRAWAPDAISAKD